MIKHLITSGSILADSLVDRASEYPIKSDANEIFLYEAIEVRSRVDDLVNENVVARQDSKYKNIKWGVKLYKYSPELAELVSIFYKEYYE